MAHPLDSAYRKIGHARNHLKTLQSETRAFVTAEANLPRFAVEIDDEEVGHVRLQFMPKIPVRLGLLVGDVIHNLRSSLDHLVYQLARATGGDGETNGFPIFEEPRKYRDNENRLLKGVIPDHRARIEALQPYNIVCQISPRIFPPESVPKVWLMTISRLDNLDKHRLLLASSGVVPARTPKFKGVRRAKGQWSGEGTWIPMKVGAELFTITEIEPLGDPNEVKVDPPPAYTIRFGDGDATPEQFWTDRTKGAVTAVDLHEAIAHIERIIGSFNSAFD